MSDVSDRNDNRADPPIDLFSAEFKRDPFPTYAAMRRRAPVYPHRAPNGSTVWYITRYEDVVAVLKDNERFVKDVRNTEPGRDDTAQTHLSLNDLINRNMLFADPPDHTRLRALVSQAFTPRRVALLEPRIIAIANDLIDAMLPHGKADLIAAFALPLPMRVIAELLGVAEQDRERVSVWSQAIIAPGSRGVSRRDRRRRMRALIEYFGRMFADRRATPRDDMVTDLVRAEADGDRLSEAELSSMVALLFVTGHETVVNMLGNGIAALLQHPEQLARLRAEPERIEHAVEELLRFDGPVETSTTRWVRDDCTFRGHEMRRGDVVRAVITSANRDAARWPQPDRLDLRREDVRHLQFGLGIHYCLGAPLARLEGRIALDLLLTRLPHIRLAVAVDALRWRSGVLFRGLEALPVAWTAPANG